ncbi:glycerate 2-kinase [Anaerolineales bacterium]|nr:glycerate 2-kinase [Anaerolineales bacterium]
MFTPEKFNTFSLQSRPIVTRILASAMNAVDASAAVKNHLHENPLPPAKHVFAFGLGKAACAMTSALADSTELVEGLVITKHADPSIASRLRSRRIAVMEGNHPVPGMGSVNAGNAALKFVSQLTRDDLLVCLISGGGSALMTAPRISLDDLQALTSALLACGGRIDEINTLRRHLDQLKGGGLARAANGAQIVSLILSDVVNDSIEAIASGPTAPDPTMNADALSIIEKYDLKDKIPAAVLSSLRETPKPDNRIFERVQNKIIASNSIALHAAQSEAQAEGFETKILRADLQGEASLVGREMALQLRESIQKMKRPFCLLAGGETTVTLRGKGKGGRNQELALGAVDALAGLEDVLLISLATDGEDGPTDAAGAVVTGESAQTAKRLGMFAADYLSRNDAHTFFDALGDLIRTGPSGTNVNDLMLCFAF